MNPNTKANQDLATANRELLLSMMNMQLSQNRRNAKAMRSFATSVTSLADEMELQEEAAKSELSTLSDSLEIKADESPRQRGKLWIMKAVDGIREILQRNS